MNTKQRRTIMVVTLVGIIVLLLLGIFMPSDILLDPRITPAELLASKPYVMIGSIVIVVPSSTIFVYLLGIQILILGYLFQKDKLMLWAYSLYFWGIGTVLAGTSYQAFGYELKCAGNEYCQFTSWFELSYLFVTALSITIMALAFAQTFLSGTSKQVLQVYPVVMMGVYTVLLLLGSVLSVQFLLSYELFTVFFMPLFVVFFVYNIIGYQKTKDALNKSFIVLWLLFLVVNVLYYVYYLPGFTESLYTETGIWFSANDVLHIGLILWFVYFQLRIKFELIDHKKSLLTSE